MPTLLASIERDLPGLRVLLIGGEACPPALVKRWSRPGRSLLNSYGPTEATVTATLGHMSPDKPVTIGRPLPTYSIVILDSETRRALPMGEAGEIGIAGIGVAEGYLNRLELTQAKFIADFLSIPNNPSGRIYRTGDLGRINGEGEIEYLGRIDTQVKLRGYRIELTEIESVLLEVGASRRSPSRRSSRRRARRSWSPITRSSRRGRARRRPTSSRICARACPPI